MCFDMQSFVLLESLNHLDGLEQGGFLMRYVLSVVSVLCVVAWLVLSYVPAAQATLPIVAFTGAWSTRWLPVLAGLALGVSGVIQFWLVIATGKLVRQPVQVDLRANVREFGLRAGPEIFLTAVPLGMTLVLGMVLFLGRQ